MRTALDTTTCQVEPGGTASVTLTVQNTGGVVDEFTVEVLGDAAGWCEPSARALPLFPQAAGTVTLAFRPERSPAVHAGPVPFGVLVQSRTDPEDRRVVEGTVVVGAFTSVTAGVLPRTSRGRLKGRHKVRVRNTGNVPATASISAADPDELLRISVRPASLTLAPGARGEARLVAKPRSPHLHGPAERRPFQVVVGGAGEPVTADATMMQKPFVTGWQIAVAALALVLIVAAVAIRGAVVQTVRTDATATGGSASGTATGTSTGTATGTATGTGQPGGPGSQGGPSGASGTASGSATGPTPQSLSGPVPLGSTGPQRITASSSSAASSSSVASSSSSQFSQAYTPLNPTAVAAASWSPSRLDLFTRGSDGSILHTWWQSGWGYWEQTPPGSGRTNDDPAAVSWGPGRIDIFVRGLDNHLYQQYYDNAWGGGWYSLEPGFTMTSAPTVASWGSGRLDIFARGPDNALWHKWYDGAWHPFERLGGSLVSAPAATSWGAGRIDVVAVQTDGRLYDMVYDAAGWHPFALIGTNQPVAGNPGLSNQGSGTLDLFIANPSGGAALHLGYSGGRWASAWDSRGGVITSGPRSVSWSPGRIDLFARGTDGAMYHQYFTGSWSGWSYCGMPVAGAGVNGSC